MIKTTKEEIRYIALRLVRGQMTQEQLREWVNTHYRDRSEDAVEQGSGTDCQNGPMGASHNRYRPPVQQDDEDDEEEDWDEDLEQEYLSRTPPPKQGQWG